MTGSSDLYVKALAANEVVTVSQSGFAVGVPHTIMVATDQPAASGGLLVKDGDNATLAQSSPGVGSSTLLFSRSSPTSSAVIITYMNGTTATTYFRLSIAQGDIATTGSGATPILIGSGEVKITDGSSTVGISTVGSVKALKVDVVQSTGGGGGDGAILDGVSSSIKATVTGANALKVDGSAVTQPVSGNVSVPSGVQITNGAGTTVALVGTRLSVDVSASTVPLPTGAATSALQTQPGVDIGDVTINNAAGAAAVNIQDGGNAITVDGTVTANAGTGPFPVSDNAGSLTVDAPVGTPVFARLSDGAAALTTTGGKLAVDPSGVTSPISAASLPLPAGAATAANQTAPLPAGTNQIGAVTLGTSTGKTNAMKTGTLATTAVTADQIVLTYTVTSGKTLYLEYATVQCRLTAVSATASILGTISLETPSGTKTFTVSMVNPTTSLITVVVVPIGEPIPVAAGAVVRIVCTPAATTSMTWIGNFGGYEK